MSFWGEVLIGFGYLFLLENAVTFIGAAVLIWGEKREQKEITALERMYEGH